MVALCGERLALEPTVDGLGLETRQPEHQDQLVPVRNADLQVMLPGVPQRASFVQLVEQPHLHDLRRGIVPGEAEPIQLSVRQLTGEVVLTLRAVGVFGQLFRRERRDLDAEQAARLKTLPRFVQKSQRVVEARQAQERVESADREPVSFVELRVSHVAADPLYGLALALPALDHSFRNFYCGYVEAGFRDRGCNAARASAPLDHGTAFALSQGDPEGYVVVVDVLQVVEFGQGIVFGQKYFSLFVTASF